METKSWWKSKTLFGAAITLGAFVAMYFGLDVSLDEQTQMVDLLVEIGTAAGALVGTVLVIVGRIKANRKLAK